MKKKTLTRYARKFLLSATGKKLIAENVVRFFNDFFMPTFINELNKTYPHTGEWKFVLTSADFSNVEITRVREEIHLLRYAFDFTCPSTDGGIRFTLQSPNYTIDVNFLPTEGFGRIEVVEKNEKNIPTAFDVSLLYIMRVSVRFITNQEELKHYTLPHLGKMERDIKSSRIDVEVYDAAVEQLVHSLGKIVLPWIEGKGEELQSWLRNFATTFWSLWNRKKGGYMEIETVGWRGEKYKFSIEITTHTFRSTSSPFGGKIKIYCDSRGVEFSIFYAPEPPFVDEAKIVFHPGTENETGVYTIYFILQPELVLTVKWTSIEIVGAIKINTPKKKKEYRATLWSGDMEVDKNLVIPQWDDPQMVNALNSLIEKSIHLIEELVD